MPLFCRFLKDSLFPPVQNPNYHHLVVGLFLSDREKKGRKHGKAGGFEKAKVANYRLSFWNHRDFSSTKRLKISDFLLLLPDEIRHQARYVGNRKKSGIFLHLLGGGNTLTFLPAPSSICIYLAQGIIPLPVVNEAWSFPCCCQKDKRKEIKSRSLKR